MRLHPLLYRRSLEEFLKEDLGHGDITTLSLGLSSKAEAVVRAKEPLVVAGIPFVVELFRILDPEATFEVMRGEGEEAAEGDELLRIRASVDALLMGERTALNLLQRLSGIATLTKSMVEAVRGTRATLVDTRKTTPGLRLFEKYAVRVGGARNHRMGLYDCAMIKDNHIKAAGGIKKAVEAVRKGIPYTARIEVEVRNLEELEEAMEAGADIALLDNMDVSTMRKAVELAAGRILLEASGGINPQNIREVAETGVDYISAGFIIHHAVWKDINMKLL